MQRHGWVIGLKPDKVEEYERLHADVWPDVLDMIKDCNIANYSIFLREFPDGNLYLFSYLEYTGEDFEGDMAGLAKEPRNIEWLKVCDAMQRPLDGALGWSDMDMVFFND